MITASEAQMLAWITPLLWPFLRALALFSSLPVFGQRTVPVRVRIALAFFISLCAQVSLPPMPSPPLDSPAALMMAAQQVMIGLTLGFSVRLVFAALEFAGEVVGLQMGLNFAAFFDPVTASQATTSARLFSTLVAWVFVVLNGHLLVIAALIDSFHVFPVTPEPLAFLATLEPARWGAEIFRLGLWISLPLTALLLFVNLVLGLVSRVAPQMNIFAIGFPITLTMGLLGLAFTLPGLEGPFTHALEQTLARFR